jgi:phosphotransferase system enzyme I (PtsI)
MRDFYGIAVSPGIATGRIVVLESRFLLPPLRKISENHVQAEIARFDEAVESVEKEILATRERVSEMLGKKYGEIFSVHLMFLKDKLLRDETVRHIRAELIPVEHAFHATISRLLGIFGKTNEDLLRDRRRDLLDVAERIFSHLQKESGRKVSFSENVIIVAHDLSPSQTAALDRKFVAGFATEIGSETSHTAIMAKALEIPAVVGVNELTSCAKENQTAILDGNEGRLILDPSDALVAEYEEKREELLRKKRMFLRTRELKPVTRDGKILHLLANIEMPEEAHNALRYGAEGVGLYRTEYLFINRDDVPSEEEQFVSYKKVAQAMGDRPVVIRTLDIGGDKFISSFKAPTELNPFLGWRAIRFCLERVDLFKAQLKAILRAGAHGNLKILLPMVSTVEEIWRTKEILREAAAELRKERKDFRNLPLGVMIEIPSAALLSAIFAKEVQFFSIGTNDLIQYTIAADRVNEKISHLYQPCNPAILKLIEMTTENARAAGIEISVCGETASIPEMAFLFIGMGLDQLSMAPSAIPQIKQVVRSVTSARAREIVKHVMRFSTHGQVFDYLKKCLEEEYAAVVRQKDDSRD